MRRRVALIAAVVLLALTLGTAVHWSHRPAPPDEGRIGGRGALAFTAPPGPAASAEPGSFTVVEARAFALLGQYDDGVIDRLPAVSSELQVAIGRMRPLLDRQRLLPGEHRPTVTPNGTFSIAPRERRTSTVAPRSASVDAAPVLAAPTRNDGPGSAASAATTLALVEPQGTAELTADGHVINGRNVWAAIRAEPGRGLPVRIADRGEGGHVVALFADDVGSLRLNGGLVVPGRYYRIQGTVEITGSAPVNVHIRPLSAVPDYHDGPLQAPSANG